MVVPGGWVIIDALTRPEHAGQELPCFFQSSESGGNSFYSLILERQKRGQRSIYVILISSEDPFRDGKPVGIAEADDIVVEVAACMWRCKSGVTPGLTGWREQPGEAFLD
jgi:hypothetical protein